MDYDNEFDISYDDIYCEEEALKNIARRIRTEKEDGYNQQEEKEDEPIL